MHTTLIDGDGTSNALLKGREAKCANLLAENDIIVPEGLKANLSYTLITQREPDNQVIPSVSLLVTWYSPNLVIENSILSTKKSLSFVNKEALTKNIVYYLINWTTSRNSVASSTFCCWWKSCHNQVWTVPASRAAIANVFCIRVTLMAKILFTIR